MAIFCIKIRLAAFVRNPKISTTRVICNDGSGRARPNVDEYKYPHGGQRKEMGSL